MAKWLVRYPDGASVEIEAAEMKLASGMNFYRRGNGIELPALVAHFPIEASAILEGVATKPAPAAKPKAAPNG